MGCPRALSNTIRHIQNRDSERRERSRYYALSLWSLETQLWVSSSDASVPQKLGVGLIKAMTTFYKRPPRNRAYLHHSKCESGNSSPQDNMLSSPGGSQ